jgi:hypothetical protein
LIDGGRSQRIAFLPRDLTSLEVCAHFIVTERVISKIIKRKKWRKMKRMGSQAI